MWSAIPLSMKFCCRLRPVHLSWLLLLLGLILSVCYPLTPISVLWLLPPHRWVAISLIVVEAPAVLWPSVTDFMLLCETLPWLVLYACRFSLSLCFQVFDWLACFLAVITSEATSTSWHDPLSRTQFPSLSLSWSFCWSLVVSSTLALFLFNYRLWSQWSRTSPFDVICQDVQLLCQLPPWVTTEFKSVFSSTSVAVGAKLPLIVAWKALIALG